MGTHSRIGVMHGDTVKSVYCHYDGYPKHVGKILVEHYNSSESVEFLTQGSSIRNFDHDGTVCRFGEGDGGVETYDTVQEALDSGFDYVYMFAGQWKCYGRDLFGIATTIDIPNNLTVE